MKIAEQILNSLSTSANESRAPVSNLIKSLQKALEDSSSFKYTSKILNEHLKTNYDFKGKSVLMFEDLKIENGKIKLVCGFEFTLLSAADLFAKNLYDTPDAKIHYDGAYTMCIDEKGNRTLENWRFYKKPRM